VLKVRIEPGMPSDHKIVFSGEGDQEAGKEVGDVVIQLKEKEHSRFQRHGTDLSMKVDIDIRESLCGFKRIIQTLDDRKIVASTNPGQVMKHGAIKQVEGEGFPTYKDPFNKGRSGLLNLL